MMAGPQAIAMSPKHLDRQEPRIESHPCNGLLSDALHGYHLRGDRLGVLEAGDADAPSLHPKPGRQVRDHLRGGQAAFVTRK